MNILQKIIANKQIEVAQLYKHYSIEQLKTEIETSPKNFYQQLAAHKAKGKKFVIAEFKRRSPSAGEINAAIDLNQQIKSYIQRDFAAVSVLTDEAFFGGNYQDLQHAAAILEKTPLLLLNKEFIIDPIQVYLARKFGANFILLIAAVLSTQAFEQLKNLAESLGMGVLAEIHNEKEYLTIQNLNCPVIGINNRDLTEFKTSINNTNYLVEKLNLHHKFIVAESGLASNLDIKIVAQKAHAYLVGTSLMQQQNFDLQSPKPLYFKACGIRKAAHFNASADLIGINFSPLSKRQIDKNELAKLPNEASNKIVAVFYRNTEQEIGEILKTYSIKQVQVYFGDVSFDFIKKTTQKIILAVKIDASTNWQELEKYIPYTDLLILDGSTPGSGAEIEDNLIPKDFKYPFLLAGGMQIGKLQKVAQYSNCIGVDIASGIETNGEVDLEKIAKIKQELEHL